MLDRRIPANGRVVLWTHVGVEYEGLPMSGQVVRQTRANVPGRMADGRQARVTTGGR